MVDRKEQREGAPFQPARIERPHQLLEADPRIPKTISVPRTLFGMNISGLIGYATVEQEEEPPTGTQLWFGTEKGFSTRKLFVRRVNSKVETHEVDAATEARCRELFGLSEGLLAMLEGSQIESVHEVGVEMNKAMAKLLGPANGSATYNGFRTAEELAKALELDMEKFHTLAFRRATEAFWQLQVDQYNATAEKQVPDYTRLPRDFALEQKRRLDAATDSVTDARDYPKVQEAVRNVLAITVPQEDFSDAHFEYLPA